MPKSGGGGAQRHVIYVPSVKNQYKRHKKTWLHRHPLRWGLIHTDNL